MAYDQQAADSLREIAQLRAKIQEQAAEIESLKSDWFYQKINKKLVAEQHKVKVLTDALWWLADSATGSELQHIQKTLATVKG